KTDSSARAVRFRFDRRLAHTEEPARKWAAGVQDLRDSACAVESRRRGAMSVFHDEVEIEDFEYDEETETYSYPCPCGDRFLITREDLENGEEVATCPSCSLIVRVIYDQEQFVCGEVVSAPTSKELVKC
ncbi:diphthamide biosynthesis 3, partial [Chelydra serpentina]